MNAENKASQKRSKPNNNRNEPLKSYNVRSDSHGPFRNESDIIQAHKKALTEIKPEENGEGSSETFLAGLVCGHYQSGSSKTKQSIKFKNYQQLYQSRALGGRSRFAARARPAHGLRYGEIERQSIRKFSQTLGKRYRVESREQVGKGVEEAASVHLLQKT